MPGPEAATANGPLIKRLMVQTTLWLAAMGAILFLAAGDWFWLQGWVFLGEIGLCSFAVSLWLLRHDPALLEARLSAPLQRDQMPWDRIFMLAIVVVFISWTALTGLDARRFGWSHVPLWAQVLGAVLIALGMAMIWQTFRFNTFAAPQVRIQAARAHRVITEGPYRIVRHPMYAGAMIYLLGTPLLLGSWWGVAAVPLLIVGLAPRAVGEERMLRRELSGYDEYAERVRFRLIPGIW
jgi:protein-S-isoprenylcysteine O-methyltransferase Ste14